MRALTLLLLLSSVAMGADVVPAARQTDWSKAGVTGGIPSRTTSGGTLTTASSLATINSTIDGAADNTAVNMGAGIYTLAGSIVVENSNVTVRGAGSGFVGTSTTSNVIAGSGSKTFATQTNLPFTAGQTVRAIHRTNPANYMQGTIDSYAAGSVTITVSASGGSGTLATWFIVRTDWTVLQFTAATAAAYIAMQDQTFADPNTNEPSIIKTISSGYTQGATDLTLNNVTSLSIGDMVCIDQLEDYLEGATGYANSHGTEGCEYCGRGGGVRMQLQISTIANIAGNVVTLADPVYMPNWHSDYTPNLWKVGSEISYSGVEDLVVLNFSDQDYNMVCMNSHNCWFKNVSSMDSEVNHFRTYLACHIEIRHCYFNGTLNGASQSYGVSSYWGSTIRCEDNVFDHVTSPMLNGPASAGCVYAYNYAVNQDYFNPNWLIEGTGTHAGHSQFFLFEGNWVPNYYVDFIHGSGSHHLAARNRFLGYDGGQESLNLHAVAIQAWNRDMSLAGNILGTTGTHDRYEWGQPDAVGSETSVYQIGYLSTAGDYPTGYDSVTYTSLIRKGNYNTHDAAIPASESLGGDTVANSYLYTSKPAYFGTLAWPPYNAASPGGASIDDIPAGYRYANAGADPPAESGGAITAGTVNAGTVTIGMP